MWSPDGGPNGMLCLGLIAWLSKLIPTAADWYDIPLLFEGHF